MSGSESTRDFDPAEWLRFIQAFPFAREWDRLRLTGDDLHSLENLILSDPQAGPVVKETGGVRKVRFATQGRGKSGGFRVYYTVFERFGVVVLMTIYPKSAKSELSREEKQVLATVVRRMEGLLEKGAM